MQCFPFDEDDDDDVVVSVCVSMTPVVRVLAINTCYLFKPFQKKYIKIEFFSYVDI